MISWLEGEKLEDWKEGSHQGIVLVCGGVGYEVQLTPRHQKRMVLQKTITLWVHQIQRDDGLTLFGFPNKNERDLFRSLIGVSGIGPQMGLSLIEELTIDELVLAITNGDLHKLCQAQGVGKRTAERLTVELRNKLSDFRSQGSEIHLIADEKINEFFPSTSTIQELNLTLTALGYEELEVSKAVQEVAKNLAIEHQDNLSSHKPASDDTDAWIRASLLWLSKKAA